MLNKKLLKKLIHAIIFISLIALTLYVVFKDNNINDILAICAKADVKYLLAAVGCMFIFTFSEGINIRRVLQNLGSKVSYIKAFKYGLAGFFFSSITPSASGGDPAQLYLMNKDDVSISHSALALLIEHSSFQLVTCILSVMGFIYHFDMLINHIGNIKYFMFLGISINIIILTSFITMIFSKKIAVKGLNVVCKILKLFRYKKADLFLEKGLGHLTEYHQGAVYLKCHKMMFLKIICTSIVQIALYFSIPYFVYRSMGLNEYGITTFILLQAVLYISVSSLPLPGAVGVSEGGFMIIFKMLFPGTLLSSGMLLSRGISFYLFVLISGMLLLIFTLADKNKAACRKNQPVQIR